MTTNKLKPGDLVVYENRNHPSGGSLATIVAVNNNFVDVNWLLPHGTVCHLTPTNYHFSCFEKIGDAANAS